MRFGKGMQRLAAALALILLVFSVAACTKGGYRVLSRREIDRFTGKNVYDTDWQRTVAEAALSLVGRVHYFWGGKYYEQGECPDWGEMRTVTSEGSRTSGETLPFGLDCSGYVTWCYAQLGMGKAELLEKIGDGTWNQWHKSHEIEKSEAQIGDIAFVRAYPTKEGNHVGIVVGFDNDNEPLIAHCSSADDNVVVSSCGESFIFFRRYPDMP